MDRVAIGLLQNHALNHTPKLENALANLTIDEEYRRRRMIAYHEMRGQKKAGHCAKNVGLRG